MVSLRWSRERTVPNPTNAVGGLFMLSLQLDCQPPSQIPPTQLVDCSSSTYSSTAN